MDSFSPQDCAFMARALRLAERGRFTCSPNPMVGCVLVLDGDIVGEGFHWRTGEDHAEKAALRTAGGNARGATAYVTLEPCAVHGRTPPCTDALIEAGIAEVVYAAGDPSPSAAGEGLKKLEAAGIRVRGGLMAASSDALNTGFLSRVQRGRPWLRLKLAASLDGAIAMATGESQWITGEAARSDVQRLRAEADAVMTGIGTVLADDPSLNLRDKRFADSDQPLRVIVDTNLRTPPGAKLLGLPGDSLVATAIDGAIDGADIVRLARTDEGVDLAELLDELGRRDVNSVLVECGPALAGSLLDAQLVDELVIYQSPHIMGSETRRLAETPTWRSLADRATLTISDRRVIGRDTRITAELQYKDQ